MSEASVVQQLLAQHQFLNERLSKEKNLSIKCEVSTGANKPDIVLFNQSPTIISDQQITAIEVKVKNWKQALKQAYRNRLFAHKTFVAIPKKYSSAAIVNISFFRKANVGLIIVDDDKINFHYSPKSTLPLSNSHFQKITRILIS